MVPNSIALTQKSPILYRLFTSSSRPISNIAQKSHLSLNPVQITGFKACSSCYLFPLNSSPRKDLGFSKLGLQLNSDRFSTSAVSGGGSGGAGGSGNGNSGAGSGDSGSGGDSGGKIWAFLSCIIKRLESINTLISSIWWVIPFYGIVAGGQTLLRDSPRLYWLTVVFLAFDVFFILFCIGMAFIVFFVAFCCIPSLAVAYAIAIREGAREDDIKSLPKYKYCPDNRLRLSDKNKESLKPNLVSSNNDLPKEFPLGPEDSDCCICLSRYINGAELYILPCKHHFHCGCISKWLRINATCPLCKLNIRIGDALA